MPEYGGNKWDKSIIEKVDLRKFINRLFNACGIDDVL